MSGFVQATIGLAIAAIVYLLSTLEAGPNLKILLIGLFLMLVNATTVTVKAMHGSIGRTALLANILIIATMTASLASNYLLQLDFRLLHFFGLWIVLFFAGHVLNARYVG